MAADVRVRALRAGDVAAVAGAMRVADQAEAALYDVSPLVGLQASIEASVEAWTVELDGQPAAIFGLAPTSGTAGAPWLLATDAFPRAWMGVARRAVRIVRTWARMMPLANYCDTQNVVALRFLEWLGFTVEPSRGRRLVRFSMPQAVR